MPRRVCRPLPAARRLLYDGGRFDPEGLLSALPAVVTALLGMFTGELIRLPKERMSGERKTLWMVVGAVVLAVVAIAGNGFVPVNKMLWSSTFVCAVGAYSLAMMALFYYVIDVRGHKGWTLFFRVVGMNSITIYMAQRIVSFGGIADFFVGGVAGLCPEQIAAVVTLGGICRRVLAVPLFPLSQTGIPEDMMSTPRVPIRDLHFFCIFADHKCFLWQTRIEN